jgi:hypothetical protein
MLSQPTLFESRDRVGAGSGSVVELRVTPVLPRRNVVGFCRVCALLGCTDSLCEAVWSRACKGVCPQCSGSGFADVVTRAACDACVEGVRVELGAPLVLTAPTRYPCRQQRTARGWSQRELYRRLCRVAAVDGESLPQWEAFKRNLNRWERKGVAVSPFYRRLLARVFDVNPAESVAVAA